MVFKKAKAPQTIWSDWRLISVKVLLKINIQFFYLEKAYDTTWKGGIMKDLHEMGLKGRLPLFIDNFLKGRKFKVRLDNTHSSLNPQEEGVPQGSFLSPTPFTVKINTSLSKSPIHAQNPLSGERGKRLSITHHALSPPPSHHHLYIIHLIN